jgi:putative RecB family exonuclease
VQLLYLRQPLSLITEPSDQSTRGTRRTLGAVWKAVERACDREDFRPNPSRLCDWCAFQAYCPAFGGDPSAVPVVGAEDGDGAATQAVTRAADAAEPAPVPELQLTR